MKKIGIMSMQRIVNYGSFLQSYGLKKIIESLGYEVSFIDYHYDKTIIEIKKNYLNKILNNINVYNYIMKKKKQKEFSNSYKKYIYDYLGITDNRNYSHDIDTLVIGSDEVFNCLQGYPVGYSKNLFGSGYEKSKIISYAASFGHTNYEKLKEYKIDKEIAICLKKFNAISVRDNNSYKTIKKLIGIKPYINLDPVLISDFELELSKYNIEEDNYIIVYAYTDRLTSDEEKYIKKFADKYSKKIISLGFYQKIADKNLVVNPFEALAYFKKASYVITDTFHGSIFAIKTQTNFCTIIRESNRNKLGYLLESLKQDKQMVKSLDDIEKLYCTKIDYSETKKVIDSEKEITINYLKNNL